MSKIRGWTLAGVAAACVVFTGCGTTHAARAKPLKAVYGAETDLTQYRVATLSALEATGVDAAPFDPGVYFTQRLAQRLRSDFGMLFDQVRVEAPALNAPDELLIGGKITKYKPGSRAGRFLGPGITPASFEAELVLRDGASGQPILIAPIDKLWAWGGGIGAAKGIEEMIDESAAAAANTIARAKGWQPSPAPR
jgi:hypothetical protein